MKLKTTNIKLQSVENDFIFRFISHKFPSIHHGAYRQWMLGLFLPEYVHFNSVLENEPNTPLV